MQNTREMLQSMISITLDVLVVKISNRAHAMVLEWASQHKDELMDNWNKAQVPEKLNQISPLE